jgi:DNA-binding NarL/FixJ family response regulator
MKAEGVSVLAKGRDGNEAIKLFEIFRPDIVVLDLMMPDYDGFYAIDGIQKIDPDAKFLVLTANVTEEASARLNQLKTIPTMYKPYDTFDVINEIKRLAGMNSTLIEKN